MATPARTILKVAVIENPPWAKVMTLTDGTMKVAGPMGNILDTISSVLNLAYEFVRPPNMAWGSPYPNGSWNGMLGQLQRREAEFAVGPFGITDERESICDFTDPMYSENIAILMVRPTLQNDIAGFVKPFSGQVWLLALMSLAVVVVVMARVASEEVNLFRSSPRWDFSKATIWGLKVFTQEGSEDVPPFNGCRLVATVWLLTSMVFMSSYSGILTAMLTAPRVTIPINSLEDLVAQDDLPWTLEDSSMMYQYFQEAKEGVKKKVFDNMLTTIQNCYSSRNAIANGEYASICARNPTKKAMSSDFSVTGKCHLYLSRENVYSNVQLAMAFQINSTYREKTNRIIHMLKEGGFLDLWLANEVINASQCLRPPSADRSTGISALNVEALIGSFLLLVGGLSASTAIFFLEVAVL